MACGISLLLVVAFVAGGVILRRLGSACARRRLEAAGETVLHATSARACFLSDLPSLGSAAGTLSLTKHRIVFSPSVGVPTSIALHTVQDCEVVPSFRGRPAKGTELVRLAWGTPKREAGFFVPDAAEWVRMVIRAERMD